MTHTPTPWKVFRTKNGVYLGVGDAEGYGIMDAGFGLWESGAIRDANAEFVVTAVNAYDKHRALIETLEKENRVLTELRRDFITLQKRIVGETGLSAIETIDKTLKAFEAKYIAEIFELDKEITL